MLAQDVVVANPFPNRMPAGFVEQLAEMRADQSSKSCKVKPRRNRVETRIASAHCELDRGDSAIVPRVDILELIDRLDDMVHNAKPVPLTDQVRVNKEEIYDLLDQMRATLPAEIEQARRLVAHRRVDVAKPGAEHAALEALIEASPLTLNLSELGARLGEAVALEEAVSSLVHHGLVDRIGDRLRASSAAVRFAELSR